jgi:uncharacterized protein
MQPVFDLSSVHRFKHPGAIDADGHVLEPGDLWDNYIEARYRDRALRIKRDAEGLECLEIGGRPSRMTRSGYPATLGRMGQKELDAFKPHPDHTGDYLQELEHMVDAMPDAARPRILGANARAAFGL